MANKTTYPKFHLWTKAVRETRCIISSHGEDEHTSFGLPAGMTVVFYVAPGQNYQGGHGRVADNILGVSSGIYTDTVTGTSCPDYKLYKLQEYHSSTYGGPMQLINKAVHKIKPGGLQVDESMEQIHGTVDFYTGRPSAGSVRPTGSIDIVTIRFRPFNEICRLSDIVTGLSALGYTEVHCAFCRS